MWLRLSLVMLVLVPASGFSSEGEEPGLASIMGQMQVYLHKFDLAVQAGNAPLAGFYLHELEESAEAVVETIETYDDHPVGELTASMLVPVIEGLEEALEVGTVPADGPRSLVASCNGCHAATDHGFIRITPATGNPYNQDFRPAR